jgi:hypothetical protein
MGAPFASHCHKPPKTREKQESKLLGPVAELSCHVQLGQFVLTFCSCR